MDVFCLIIWILWLVDGICCYVKKKDINKIAYFCAVLICILHFLGNIIG